MSKSEAYLADVLDPRKVILECEVHHYVPGRDIRKHTGCKQCIMADYVKMFAETPPELRAERLDQFEALIHTMCELEDEGKLDITLQRHPTIQIEKDAIPD
jgi:hypothetical protein